MSAPLTRPTAAKSAPWLAGKAVPSGTRRLFSAKSGNPRLVAWCASLVFGLVWFRAADYLLPAWTLRFLLLLPILFLGVTAGHLLQ